MLLKYVIVIFFCIAGEATCTIVHIQITQMNTAVTTTVIYASDSTANVFILTTPLLMLYIISSAAQIYIKRLHRNWL